MSIHKFNSYRPPVSPDQERDNLKAREADLCRILDNARQELGYIARRLVQLERNSNLMPDEMREG